MGASVRPAALPTASRRAALGLPRPAVAGAGAVVLGALLLSGVTPGEVVRAGLYEALYVLLPGCLLYLLLSPRPGGRLRTVAIGWPLGYAIEVGAFALTAALHARGAFAALPLLSPALAVPLMVSAAGRERLRALLPAARPDLELPAVALAIAAGVTVLALTFFASSPLPVHARSVAYSGDNVFDISIAADARHHWPITEPWVAGQPLRYYTAAFIHVAAANQVAGIPLATGVLRLLPAVALALVALQLWALGRTVGRSPWIGPLAAALLLVTEDVNLAPTRSQLFHISPFTQFPLSPTFAFGATFLLGAILLLQTHVALPAGGGGRAGGGRAIHTLALFTILALGAGAAKTFAIADLFGGLGLYWLWCLARGRLSRQLTYCLLAVTASVAVVYFTMLAGGGADSVKIHPFSFLSEGDTLKRATSTLKDLVGTPLYVPVLALGGVALAPLLLAPLSGAAWWLYRHRRAGSTAALLWAVFAAGLVGYLTVEALEGVEGVFLVYGYIALLPVAAAGLVELWEETPAHVRRRAVRMWVATLALGVALGVGTLAVSLHGHALQAWYAVAYGALAAAVAVVVVRLQRHHLPIASRLARIAACGIPPLVVLGLIKPAMLVGSGAWKTVLGRPTSHADTPQEYGMTAPLYRGLRWVSSHTRPCDVLAVSNHYYSAGSAAAIYFYYSAFAERRVYLESWYYTTGGLHGGLPFPRRLALSDRATRRGDPRALRRLARDGVSYVLIDRTHGGGAPEPPTVSRLVFANSALDVYRLLPVHGARRAGCGTVL